MRTHVCARAGARVSQNLGPILPPSHCCFNVLYCLCFLVGKIENAPSRTFPNPPEIKSWMCAPCPTFSEKVGRTMPAQRERRRAVLLRCERLAQSYQAARTAFDERARVLGEKSKANGERASPGPE